MSTEMFFFLIAAFFAGRVSKGFKIYIGSDENKYKESNLGLLFKK